MKHNQHNIEFKFQRDPVEFNKWTDKPLLQYCLGGTLYMPGTRSIVDKIQANALPALKSMVMCFEDAIRAEDVAQAEDNVLGHLSRLADAIEQGRITHDEIALTFLRVRTPEQFRRFSGRLTERQANVLSGFVFPKFSRGNAAEYLDELQSVAERLSTPLYGMPILEGRTIGYRETRIEELQSLKQILDPYRDRILNIRVGGTDLSSLFGVRRGINSSIYDILPVRDALADILNLFSRTEDGYTVSGAVWEYFLAHRRDDIQELLLQNLQRSLITRQPILNDAVDGLLREVIIDKANGFVGKTVIHPSHLKYVNAMQAITLEEYEDALQILQAGDGVVKSGNGNKMNEANPHRSWALGITLRAQAFGVIKNEDEYIRLFMEEDDRPVSTRGQPEGLAARAAPHRRDAPFGRAIPDALMELNEQSMLIASFEHWDLFLAKDAAPYLGRCVAWAKRPEAKRFIDMTREEGEELSAIVALWLKALSRWLESQGEPLPYRENVAILGNSEPHLHAHLVPRYEEPVCVFDKTFIDPRPHQHYRPYERVELPAEVKERIAKALREHVTALISES